MTPDAWVDLAYSALVAGVIALFFREYDSEAEAEEWLEDSVMGGGAGGREITRLGHARPRQRPPVTSP